MKRGALFADYMVMNIFVATGKIRTAKQGSEEIGHASLTAKIKTEVRQHDDDKYYAPIINALGSKDMDKVLNAIDNAPFNLLRHATKHIGSNKEVNEAIGDAIEFRYEEIRSAL